MQPSGDKVQSTGYEKHKIRMTQMTLMTLNLGYGIGISSKQRHKRHQRHYRHARMLPGGWGTPQKCVCGYPNAMLAKHVYPQNDDKQTRYPHKFVYALQSESLLIHPKILTRKSESVLIHSLRQPAKNYNCITKITIRRFHGTLYWIQNSFAKGRKTVCVQN